MELSRQIEFLRAKVSALAMSGALPQSQAEALVAVSEKHFARLEKNDSPQVMPKDIDEKLETMLRMFRNKRDAEAVRAKMRERFGFSSLKKTPDRLAKAVLKRGKIQSEEELYAVRDLLSDGDPKHYFKEAEVIRLGGILDAHERGG